MEKGKEDYEMTSRKSSVAVSVKSGKEAKKGRDENGLGMWQTSFFILGEVAGSGVLALPNALKGTGYIGIALILAFSIMAAYTGMRLGKCWTIMEERYEEYRNEEVRQPYQAMASKTYGKWMMWFVTVAIHFTLLGGCVVYVLLISGMLGELFQDIWPVSICYWAMMVVAIMIPLSWLGTPKDFWQIALVASVTVLVACVLIVVQCFLDIGLVGDEVRLPSPTLKSFSLSFGTILFAYGGATAFPTFQNDMKDRKKFSQSTSVGFCAIVFVYLFVSCCGYFIYGNEVLDNVAETISAGGLRYTAQILLIIHLFCAFVMVINPCFQDLEEYLHIKEEFSIKRCAFRTLIVGVVLFIGETVPQFSKIQNLIGASGSTLLTFIFPVFFYMKLCNTKNPAWKERKISLPEMTFMVEIIVVGTIAGIVGTVSAIYDLTAPDALSLPCYVSLADPV